MQNVLVMHHDDMDGRCAAAIVKKKHPEARCFEVNYSDPLPIDVIDGDIVFIVDFTPPLDADFERITNNASKVFWIDHHGKNIVKHKFYDQCLDGLRVEKTPSGAGCCWQFLFPEISVPDSVLYVSDYDCWIYDYGLTTKAFQAGIHTVPHSPDDTIWMDLLDCEDQARREKATNDIISKGKVVLDFRKIWFNDVVKKGAFVGHLDGHRVLCCNMPNVGSNLFEGVDTSEFDIVSTFYTTGDKIIVGLYSEGETVDCAEIASKLGGGGHKGAAGFECTHLPFTDIEEVNL